MELTAVKAPKGSVLCGKGVLMRVRELIEDLREAGNVRDEDLLACRGELKTLVKRLARVRALGGVFSAVELGPEVEELLKRAALL